MSRNPVRPKKALGQHFLTDLSIARRIAATLAVPERPDLASLPVLEIGPGTGVLSQFLLADGRELKAVEIDAESVAYLAANFPQLPVVQGDFLTMPLADIFPSSFALIGNYPYNISSQIFFRLLEFRDRIPLCTGMLQREVAQRICAPPGGRDRGILSVLLQTWYDCEYLFTVPESVFNPPPKVKSGVLRLVRNTRRSLPVPEELFRRVVKTAFGMRRKTLRNSLASLLPKSSPLPAPAPADAESAPSSSSPAPFSSSAPAPNPAPAAPAEISEISDFSAPAANTLVGMHPGASTASANAPSSLVGMHPGASTPAADAELAHLLTLRPEQLSVDQFIALTAAISSSG